MQISFRRWTGNKYLVGVNVCFNFCVCVTVQIDVKFKSSNTIWTTNTWKIHIKSIQLEKSVWCGWQIRIKARQTNKYQKSWFRLIFFFFQLILLLYFIDLIGFVSGFLKHLVHYIYSLFESENEAVAKHY